MNASLSIKRHGVLLLVVSLEEMDVVVDMAVAAVDDVGM